MMRLNVKQIVLDQGDMMGHPIQLRYDVWDRSYKKVMMTRLPSAQKAKVNAGMCESFQAICKRWRFNSPKGAMLKLNKIPYSKRRTMRSWLRRLAEQFNYRGDCRKYFHLRGGKFSYDEIRWAIRVVRNSGYLLES